MKVVKIICGFVLIGNFAFSQEDNTIVDFYEYANKDWLESIEPNNNTVVVNNWGMIWDSISNKSIEILSSNKKYNLDKEHLYTLDQLRSFYKSSINTNKSSIASMRLTQKYFPMLFGVVFSEITISTSKEKKIKELIKYLNIALWK